MEAANARERLLARGERVGLRPLVDADATERYLGWMRDPEVVRHLEARFAEHSLASLRAFIAEHGARDDTLLLAIVALEDGGLHVGNIKVGPLVPWHRTADVGLLIGDKSWWGRGLGTEAIELATRLAGEHLGARKLTASCYRDNVGSARAFLRAGWTDEGHRPAQFVDVDQRAQDQLLFGIVLHEAP